MSESYWQFRMEKWGAWRIGVRGRQVSPLFRVMNGVPRSTDVENLPRDYAEENETNELVLRLPQDQRYFAFVAYPKKTRIAQELGMTPEDFRRCVAVLHKHMAVMLDQRRRGEPLNPSVSRRRVRIQKVQLEGTVAAAVTK